MSEYILIVGDVVDFVDPYTNERYRGYIDKYDPSRDTRKDRALGKRKHYYVKFDTPLWSTSYKEAWCAAEDLKLIRMGHNYFNNEHNNKTITYSYSPFTNKPIDKENIKLTATDSISQSTITQSSNKPWTAYYLTSDEFFDVLKVAFEDTYGSDHKWHPEDLYVNVSCTLEIVSNTLSNMVNVKAGRQLKGIKST